MTSGTCSGASRCWWQKGEPGVWGTTKYPGSGPQTALLIVKMCGGVHHVKESYQRNSEFSNNLDIFESLEVIALNI